MVSVLRSSIPNKIPSRMRPGGSNHASGVSSDATPVPVKTEAGFNVLCTCHSPRLVRQALSRQDASKKGLIHEVGLGGLLEIPPISNMDRTLSLWLLRMMDPEMGNIMLENGVELKMSEDDVSRVLSIRSGDKIVSESSSEDLSLVESKVKKVLGVTRLNLTTVTNVWYKLKDREALDVGASRAFQAAAVLLCSAYFVWSNSRGGATICKEVLEAVSVPELLHRYNWAELFYARCGSLLGEFEKTSVPVCVTCYSEVASFSYRCFIWII